MRDVKYLVLHCTASPQTQTVEAIKAYWKNSLGWKNPGYHFLIKADGEIVNLLPIEEISNGVAGYNANSIHISYIGGVDKKGNPIDNRTPQQIQSQFKLISKYKYIYPKAVIKGHRDFLKKGASNWKDCPSFSVSEWLTCTGLNR